MFRLPLQIAIPFAALAVTGSVLAYVPDERWSTTAAGSTGASGTPATITWSIARDGTAIPGESASNLVSYLDGLWNVSSTSNDLTLRPWFGLFRQSFDRWTELGGVTFVYEPNDSTSASLQTSAGVTGVRGDIRLGGSYIDGDSGTLAYTWLPNSGDMVIDTGETDFYVSTANNYRQFRNTVMHELGHALGLLHIESSSDALLLEPYINTSFDGPQLDDIRGLQGLYGDALEKANGGLGNGTSARASALGTLAAGGTLAIGSAAVGDQRVSASETDFVSIANRADTDFYSFTVTAPTLLSASLTPLGGVFSQGVEGGTESVFDANSRNNLALAILDTNGTSILATASNQAAGVAESLTGIELITPGQYYARITGATDNVQLYELRLTGASLIVPLTGDCNNDGVVDAADYIVWRDSFGRTAAGLAADGDRNGTVNAADLAVWQNNFGMQQSGALLTAATVPEPNASILLVASAIGIWHYRRRCGE